jgi:hypothetical protein
MILLLINLIALVKDESYYWVEFPPLLVALKAKEVIKGVAIRLLKVSTI